MLLEVESLALCVYSLSHRRSIEGLRKERQEHQMCSESPSKHHRSCPPGGVCSSTVSAAAPSRCKEYLQQLRQEVIDGTRYSKPPADNMQNGFIFSLYMY